MDIVFFVALLFLAGCLVFRKEIAKLFSKHNNTATALPVSVEQLHPTVVAYKVLAYNARDYSSTKELENMMELRLEQALAGLAKQGTTYEVEFHSTGFVLVYLIKYWC